MSKLWIKDHECTFSVFLVKRLYQPLESYIPHCKEEPITNDEPSLLSKHFVIFKVGGYPSNWSTLRPIVLEILYNVSVLESFEEVEEVVENRNA